MAMETVGWLAFDIGGHRHAWAGQVGDRVECGSVDNDPAALRALLQKRIGQVGRLRVLAEATGIYHLDVVLLADELGAEVMVINPKAAHHFALALGQRAKTDALDAKMLLEGLKRLPFRRWQPPRAEWRALRSYGRFLTQMTQDRVVTLNRLHAAQSTRTTPAFLLKEYQRKLAHLDRTIARIRKAAEALIHQDETLRCRYAALCTIKGIGEVSAVALLSELMVVPRALNSRACTSLAGLDPQIHESGTSVHKPPHISRHGNKYLRQALFMPALTHSTFDPHAKTFKQRLLDRGKKPIQAIVAIMRKLLTVIWAMIKNPQPFDASRLYFTPKTA